MSRPPSNDPDATPRTVSVSVSVAEAAEIAAAAGHATMTKSGWITARTMLSLQSGQRRNAVMMAAKAIENEGTPKGLRSARVSAVMQVSDHEAVKKAAVALGLTVHAYLQAVAVSSATAELADLPKAQRRALDRAAGTSGKGHGMMIVVPAEFQSADLVELGELLHKLVAGTCAKIRDGQAKPIMEGAPKLAAQVKAAPHVTLRLAVPEFEVMAAAHVLGIAADDYATALATRAARTLVKK